MKRTMKLFNYTAHLSSLLLLHIRSPQVDDKIKTETQLGDDT